MTSDIYGLGQGIPNRPAVAKARPDSVRSQSRYFGPFDDGSPFSHVFQKVVLTGIAKLLPQCRPSAILGGIGAIVINSVEAMPGGPLSHVGQKVWETGTPTVANPNAASAVVVVLRRCGSIAASQHGIIRWAQRVFGEAVSITFGSSKFTLQTATASIRPVLQLIGTYQPLRATVAPAQPVGAAVAVRVREGKGRPSAEVLPGQVFASSQASLVSGEKPAWLALDPAVLRAGVFRDVRALPATTLAETEWHILHRSLLDDDDGGIITGIPNMGKTAAMAAL